MSTRRCCCDDDCITDCPVHAAEVSYSAVIGSHSATLTSPDGNCDFIGSSCVLDATTVTNSWEDTSLDSHTFTDIFTCSCDTDCCNGSQVPGEERSPATTQLVQTAYTRRDKWKRWEQLRESMTIQLYDVGGGNLRILVTVLKEIRYMVGANTIVRGGYRVATVTYCTPAYTDLDPTPESFIVFGEAFGDFGDTLPEIPCSISYDAPVWDAWPAHPDPNYPECPHFAEYQPSLPGCEFTAGAAVTYEPTLETDTIGPFDQSVCVADVCVSSTFNTSKVKSRLYELSCNAELVYGGLPHDNCYTDVPLGIPNYRAFGYYYYYSDPFPCDAFPANPIALMRDPYTDIASSTSYKTVCGQTFPYFYPAVSKDLTITIT